MADVGERFDEQRTARRHHLRRLHIDLPRHGTDDQRIAVIVDVDELRDAVQVHQVIGIDEAHV